MTSHPWAMAGGRHGRGEAWQAGGMAGGRHGRGGAHTPRGCSHGRARGAPAPRCEEGSVTRARRHRAGQSRLRARSCRPDQAPAMHPSPHHHITTSPHPHIPKFAKPHRVHPISPPLPSPAHGCTVSSAPPGARPPPRQGRVIRLHGPIEAWTPPWPALAFWGLRAESRPLGHTKQSAPCGLFGKPPEALQYEAAIAAMGQP